MAFFFGEIFFNFAKAFVDWVGAAVAVFLFLRKLLLICPKLCCFCFCGAVAFFSLVKGIY